MTRGPMPKDAALRQRRNKATTRAVLPAEGEVPRKRAPKLPERSDKRAWHKLTLAWWRAIWRSPMSTEYLESDVPRLFRLAALIDQFWTKPDKDLDAAICRQEQAFGLSPLDRRRLEWSVAQAEEAKEKRPRRGNPPTAEPFDDPRRFLQVVS